MVQNDTLQKWKAICQNNINFSVVLHILYSISKYGTQFITHHDLLVLNLLHLNIFAHSFINLYSSFIEIIIKLFILFLFIYYFTCYFQYSFFHLCCLSCKYLLLSSIYIFSHPMFIVMQQYIKAKSLHVKTFLAINLILIQHSASLLLWFRATDTVCEVAKCSYELRFNRLFALLWYVVFTYKPLFHIYVSSDIRSFLPYRRIYTQISHPLETFLSDFGVPRVFHFHKISLRFPSCAVGWEGLRAAYCRLSTKYNVFVKCCFISAWVCYWFALPCFCLKLGELCEFSTWIWRRKEEKKGWSLIAAVKNSSMCTGDEHFQTQGLLLPPSKPHTGHGLFLRARVWEVWIMNRHFSKPAFIPQTKTVPATEWMLFVCNSQKGAHFLLVFLSHKILG